MVRGQVWLEDLSSSKVVGELRQGEVGDGAASGREEVEKADQTPHICCESGGTEAAERQFQ